MGDAISSEQQGRRLQEAERWGNSGLTLTVGDQPALAPLQRSRSVPTQQSCSQQLCRGTRHPGGNGSSPGLGAEANTHTSSSNRIPML